VEVQQSLIETDVVELSQYNFSDFCVNCESTDQTSFSLSGSRENELKQIGKVQLGEKLTEEKIAAEHKARAMENFRSMYVNMFGVAADLPNKINEFIKDVPANLRDAMREFLDKFWIDLHCSFTKANNDPQRQ